MEVGTKVFDLKYNRCEIATEAIIVGSKRIKGRWVLADANGTPIMCKECKKEEPKEVVKEEKKEEVKEEKKEKPVKEVKKEPTKAKKKIKKSK
jgi:hypothetical protein